MYVSHTLAPLSGLNFIHGTLVCRHVECLPTYSLQQASPEKRSLWQIIHIFRGCSGKVGAFVCEICLQRSIIRYATGSNAIRSYIVAPNVISLPLLLKQYSIYKIDRQLEA